MPRSRRARPPFEPASLYEYPEHLRATLADLPAAPGVYIFHGEEGDLPLYIGKSVNIRARLLSHLRNPEEARLLRQTQRITHLRTAGEIGALLLEARLIKEQHPLYNQKLRQNRQLCSLQLVNGTPQVVYSRELDFAITPGLHGLFSSRAAALECLRDLADQHRLCYGSLGLEKLPAGKACFRASLRLCAGVCRGDEPVQTHAGRLQGALRPLHVECWPYPDAVGVVERDEDFIQVHVVHRWSYLGSASSVEAARPLAKAGARFDADVYRILVRPLLSGSAELLPL